MGRGGYHDRTEAGRALAAALADRLAGLNDSAAEPPLVLALPRGGVPVAVEVARRLAAPLDVLVVRKLGAPGREELALGAIASDVAGADGEGPIHLNRRIIDSLGVDEQTIRAIASRERDELRRRARAYRGDRPPPEVAARRVVLVDDGLATGATMLAAAEAMRAAGAAFILVAVPVGAPDTVRRLAGDPAVDEVVCPLQPQQFHGVGEWYQRFEQVDDDAVRRRLAEAWA